MKSKEREGKNGPKTDNERALEKSDARFRAVVEWAPSAMLLVNGEGRIVMVNTQAERSFGYSRSELLGQPMEMLVPERFRHHHSHLRTAYFRDPGSRPMGTGRDLFAMRKDGSEFLVEIGLNPIETEDGMMVLSAIVDITDRQQAMENLRLSDERFRSIFSAVSEGIFIVDAATGTFIDVNEPGAAMFGYAFGELVGRDIEIISSGVPPYTQREATELIAKAAASGRPQRMNWHCKAKDGRNFWSEISFRFASIGNRGVVLAVARDITERQAIEAQLRQAQKMEAIGNLTGGMAHDFNNLLGVIIGNLDLLRELIDNQEMEELAREAFDAAMRGADLNRRLLAFARRQPLEPKRINVNELIGDITKLLDRMLGEDIEIAINCAPDIWPVVADPAQLESAIMNLATNARDAMSQGGRLTFATRNTHLDEDYAANHVEVVAGDYIVIEVGDTGMGIEPANLNRIFEPFFTTKELGKGTGLGLAMVFGFMRQSGGHVNVYSEPGKGTVFRLYLPRGAEGVSASAPAVETLAQGGGETVLVVEDNDALRRVVVRQLTDLGYRVIQADTAVSALALLDDASHIDLLLTDIVMPGGVDGIQLARDMQMRRPKLKVLLSSGFPEARLRDGNDMKVRLLSKPYTKAELARVTREVLNS